MAARKSEKKLIRSLDSSGFFSDFSKEGALYAALVRSPAPSGKIQDIRIANIPEGYFLFTAKDIPASRTMAVNKTTLKIFGFDTISYTGEPIGILIGPDEEVISRLLDEVTVIFDVENLESALHNVMNNSQKTPDDFTDFVDQINDMPSLDTVIDKSLVEEDPNVTIATREVKYGLYETKTVEEADKELFETADFTSTDTWKSRINSPKWQETEGAFCYMEGSSLHVYTPTRWISFTQRCIAETLGIDYENIFIHKTKASGIYPTGLWKTTQLALQTAIAAYLSKKPVKLILSQTEQDAYMAPGVMTEIKYKTAANKDGLITALNVSIDIDVGSSNPFAQEITDRITLAVCNYYHPENLYIYANTHTSKNPPTTLSIKVVDSQAFFAIENQIQKISNQAHLLPDEVRLVNSMERKLKKDQRPFPFDIQLGNQELCLQTTIKNSDFNRKYASFHMEAIDRVGKDNTPFFALPLRGIGIGTGYVISGYYGSTLFPSDTKIEVTLNTDDKVIIHAIKPSEVIQDIWKTTASEILQIPKQNIVIHSDFPLSEIPNTPEDSNYSIGITNELIKKCCADIQKKRFHQALPLSAKKTIAKSTKSKWNKETFEGNPYITPSFISTIVEVELDTYTYNEKIKGIWITIDCGDLFDEAAAIRTVRLEIQQELGMLVQGKTVTCDLINIQFIKSSNKAGQVNGLVHNSLPAAFSSALSLALATQLSELPCTEDLLFQLIKNRTRPDIQGGESK